MLGAFGRKLSVSTRLSSGAHLALGEALRRALSGIVSLIEVGVVRMSKAATSPTARLLQQSRLFSLPRPLPQPSLETLTSTGTVRSSDTATRPYPTHQAIATPPSSHFRGDWGLKRQIPGKATRSGQPIRIVGQDTIEHITDFQSASDHTRTLAKWQEMEVPLVQRSSRNTISNPIRGAPVSVYEEWLDNTDPNPSAPSTTVTEEQQVSGSRRAREAQQSQKQRQRWKYSGPHLAGMGEGEFTNYLVKTIERRRGEWQTYLANHLSATRAEEARRKARDRGEELDASTFSTPSKQDLTDFEKKLRDDHADRGLGSDLTALLTSFLDLPSSNRSAEPSFAGAATSALRGMVDRTLSPEEDEAPPSTHPGAGLSHIRTNAFMSNHPLYGPQAYRNTVEARVLRPRNSSIGGSEYYAKLGVGGVVANDAVGSNFNPANNRGANRGAGVNPADQATAEMDPEKEGGNKIWVHPETAFVNDAGRISLAVSRGDKEAIAVKTGEVEPILEARNAASRPSPLYTGSPNPAATGRPGAWGMPGTRENANYGHALPDLRAERTGTAGQQLNRQSGDRAINRSRVQGFDEELGRSREQRESAADRIREILERRR